MPIVVREWNEYVAWETRRGGGGHRVNGAYWRDDNPRKGFVAKNDIESKAEVRYGKKIVQGRENRG